MSFTDIKVFENSLSIGITDLIQSFTNAKEFFSNSIDEENDKSFITNDLDSIESHKQYFNKYPIVNAIYEIPVKHKFKYKNIDIILSGRIDAYDEKSGIVYELKIYEKSIENIVDSGIINLFKTQLFFYGYILKKRKKLVDKLKLIIGSISDSIIKEFEYNFDNKLIYSEIKKLFPFLYDIYLFESSKSKNINLKAKFPYEEIRLIQKQIINHIFESNKKLTFLEAPFASGKTAATLYGLANKYNFNQIHYFTSRNIQKQQVYDEGTKIGFKPIIRKSFKDSCSFSYSFCKKYGCKKYFYPIERYSILKNNGCPVIYQRLFYNMYDLVIADYNLLFFQALAKTDDTICVIDEYHSFLNRISDFFTISITKTEIDKVKELCFIKYKWLEKDIFELFDKQELNFDNLYYEIYSKSIGYIDEIKSTIDQDFIESIIRVIVKVYNYINQNCTKDLTEFENEIYPFFQKLKKILELSRFDMVVSYSKNSNEKIFTYKSIKPILNNLYSGYKAVFGISATLEPKQLIYFVHDTQNLAMYSEMTPKKIRTYIIENIETIYKKREKNLYLIANTIKRIINKENKENNLCDKSILIFFPSYDFISMVEPFIVGSSFDKIIIKKENRQTPAISSRVYSGEMEKIRDFLVQNKIHLIFLPYRSIIQEGANLNFDIAGGIFVGLPFRVPDNQYLTHSVLMDEYYENSFDILSLFPALNDVLQSSGRIGRKEINDNFIYFIGKEFTDKKVIENIKDFYPDIEIIEN